MHVRSLLAVALAALLATPAVASAQARGTTSKTTPRSGAGAGALTVGGWLGYESGDLDGVQLRVEGEMAFQRLTPQIDLSFVGALGYSRLGDSGFGVDVTANVFRIVPAARFTLGLNPQLSVFGDAGIGVYYSSVSFEFDVSPLLDQDDSAFGLMLRLGAGGLYAVNPRTKIGVQLALDPMFGDELHSDTPFTILAGVTFQL